MMATTSSTEEEKKLSAMAERFCRRFSLAEIQLATEDFSEAHLIGEGGFGKVYKGLIDNRQLTVAIKQLAPNSNQGANEFLMEIETLSMIRHVNLVSLIGYCSENREMILVYDYIAQGTLADHLYRPSGDNDDCLSLTWKQRLQTCIGAARGLEYLHTGSSIIHRDVKSTNILLDENFTAKVSDFGLAKHLSASNSKSHVSTIVKGSFGFLDPSYFTTGRLTRKSDTYAFGVVLLEVLCGRPAVDPRVSEDAWSLVIWAREKIRKGKVQQIVASNLRDEISADCLKTFVKVAKRCLHLEPEKRPTMAQVVVQLEFALEQQERRESTYQRSRFLPLNAFWNRVKPSGNPVIGSAENVDVNKLTFFEGVSLAFDLEDLLRASAEVLGNGTFGTTYKATSKDATIIAVKRLKEVMVGRRDFEQQMEVVGNIRHENVAPLRAYFYSKDEKLMVYDYYSQGSVSTLLHAKRGENRVPLDWETRVRIAIGTARGIAHIHSQSSGKLVHGNIKASNIFLNSKHYGCVSDLGLATLMNPIGAAAVTRTDTRKASQASDVYSFGVVLLELLTGKSPVHGSEDVHLVRWVHSVVREEWDGEVFDVELLWYPNIEEEMVTMLQIGMSCVGRIPAQRPRIGEVVKMLEEVRNGNTGNTQSAASFKKMI